MKKLGIVAGLFAIFLVTLFVWWKNGTAAANTSDKKEYTFVVAKDEGVRSIANRLKKQNLIKDPTVFFLLVKKFPIVGLGLDDKIQAGDHRISPSMTTQQVAKSLTLATNDVWVTVVEGQRSDEIADTLKKDIRSYKESWRKELVANEGYLFPDTYLIPKDSTIKQVVSILRNNFESKYSTIDSGNKDKQEIVTVASLVEREAKHAEDRPLVASVIYNRLEIGMKLDIDATVQYVLGYQEDEKRWWKKNLTEDDLRISSPYNTYRNAGLPPTPISNPGIDSLSAAANPAQTNYLYYVSDKKGMNHYSATLEEHNINREKYLSQ